MKKIIIIIVFFTTFNLHSQWKPAGDNIKTKWADNIDPENVLKEYPRPLLVRKDWKNLNGLWDYSITGKGMSKPKSFDGKILVPFSIESSLSGVQKRISENNEL